MKISSLSFLALATGGAAFWRMPVRFKTGVARIDPIVAPGGIADHAHVVFGGGNFGQKTTFSDLVDSNCTSAGVYEDKSAYWSPGLYFQYANGTAELVNTVGGMLAYYQLNLDNLKAFPEGFQMLSGNPTLRYFPGPFPDTDLSSWPTDPDPNNQTFLEQRALGFNCLNYQQAPEPSLYRHQLPSKEYMDAHCTDGLRLELAFPSCGNGSLDSADHKSHVKFPSLVKEGNCPEGFDVHYPFLFFETIYDTYHYEGVDGQFVLSTGDPVGTSYHGDFIMGWDSADFLQKAVDTCTNLSGEISDCPLFTPQSDADASQCEFSMPDELKADNVLGPRDGLPVNVPIQYGPQRATKYAVAGQNNVPTTSLVQTSTPSTFNLPTQQYTTATTSDPVLSNYGPTPALLGSEHGDANSAQAVGFNKAASPQTSTVTSSTSTAAPSQEVTTAPSLSSGTGKAVATSYFTTGNQVVELVYEEVDVTVTAIESVYASATAKKRHLDAHKHRHHNA